MTSATQRSFNQISLASGGAFLAAACATTLFWTGSTRSGALTGLVAAGVPGAIALAMLRRSIHGSVNALLKAIVTGFLLRMALVGLGLAAVIRLWSQDTAVPFAVAFFGMFFLLQGLEFAYALRAMKAPKGETP